MSVSIIIISIGLVSAICTSIVASLIHKMNWHKTGKKSKFRSINLCFSNFYQFNNHFYNAFSFFRELMINSLIITLFFKYLVCESKLLETSCIMVVFIIVFVLRTISFLVVYSKFYDEELVK